MQVDWFWQVLCEATVETRLRILTWTTGLARAPLGGCLCCNMGVSTAHTRTHTHAHTHTHKLIDLFAPCNCALLTL